MAQIDITKQRTGMFVHALADAQPGDEIIYHVGEYAGGCHKHDAAAAAEAKLCLLYQRRAGKLFAYIARKPIK
jgi:hypothetical protein